MTSSWWEPAGQKVGRLQRRWTSWGVSLFRPPEDRVNEIAGHLEYICCPLKLRVRVKGARSNLMNAEKLTELWLNLCLDSLLCDPSANNEFALVTFSSCQFITLLTCHFFHLFIISSCLHILPPAPSILNAGKLAAPVGEDKMKTGAQPDSHKSLNWWANIQSLISKGLKECSSLCIFHHRHKYVFYEINIYAINRVPGQHGVLGAAGLFGEDQVGILLLRCCVACSPWQAGHLSTYSIIIILSIKTRFLFNHLVCTL